jgi:hypothetical protein
MFYVYLLHSIADAGFYIGYSTDLKRRLSEHKQGAAFATKHRGPWKIEGHPDELRQLQFPHRCARKCAKMQENENAGPRAGVS